MFSLISVILFTELSLSHYISYSYQVFFMIFFRLIKNLVILFLLFCDLTDLRLIIGLCSVDFI